MSTLRERSDRSQSGFGADLLEALAACVELINTGRSADGEGLRDVAVVQAFGDGRGPHIHVSRSTAPMADRIAAHLAMGLAELVVSGESQRVRACASPTCRDVFVDLSRNRSRRYCDSRTCGNRLHVAAYRARRSQAG
jgi:predicted RNA-binding Zn ribbon-like protein